MVPTVRTGPAIGFAVQILVLAALAATTGLGPWAWLAGIAYGAELWAVLRHQTLGPADRVTLFRATLVGGVTALAVDALTGTGPAPRAVLVPLAALALSLDSVDGWVARRTHTESERGARFDYEVDAYLLLVLSVYLVRPAGVWVLAIGAMRYAFIAAGWALPWLRAPLPGRLWGKAVAVIQGIALVVAAADVLPRALNVVMLAVALALLVESFGRSIVWLWRHRALRGPGLESLPGRPVRRRRHDDPAVRQRRDAAA
jgi:phosphatidylglycerophosphate synthase